MMVLLLGAKTLVAKKFANESATAPTHVAFGTGTTSPSRSDSGLTTEDARVSVTEDGYESNVGYFIANITNTDTSLHNAIYEDGLVNASVSGDFYTHEVHGGFTPGTGKTCRITKFVAVQPSSNTNRAIVTQHAVEGVVDWFTGGTFPSVGTHVGWSAPLIIDQMDSITGWSNSADASADALDSINFIEGTASIKMGKSGTSGATFYYDRTLGSPVVASSATHIRIYINIASSTTYNKLKTTGCLKVWFGNDTSNYYSYSINRDNLFVGFQRLEIAIADMTQTGTVNLATIDYERITWETTNASDTIASGELLMDLFSFWWPLAYTDTTLHQEITRQALSVSASRSNEAVTYESSVAKATGNSYEYNYFGLFDASSSGNLLFVVEILLQKGALVLINHKSLITTTIRDY